MNNTFIKTILILAVFFLFTGLLQSAEKENTYVKPKLAVLPLDTNSVDSATLQAVSELVQSRLENSGLYVMIERDKLAKVLQEQKFQLSGAVDNNTIAKIGKISGASKLVVGTINKFGSGFVLSARIVDVETAEIDISANEISKSALDLKDSVDCLCKALIEKDRSKYQAFLRSKTYKNSLRVNAGSFQVYSSFRDIISDFGNYNISYRRQGIPLFGGSNIFTEFEAGFFSFSKQTFLISQDLQYIPATVNFQYYIPLDFFLDVYGKAGAGASYGKLTTTNSFLETEKSETSIDPLGKIGIGFDTSKNYRLGLQIEILYNYYFMSSEVLNGISINGGFSYNW